MTRKDLEFLTTEHIQSLVMGITVDTIEGMTHTEEVENVWSSLDLCKRVLEYRGQQDPEFMADLDDRRRAAKDQMRLLIAGW